MGELNPNGYVITLGDKEYHFLFTLNAIDEVQTEFNTNCLEALNKMFSPKESTQALKKLVKILVNDDLRRHGVKTGMITEEEAGWLIDVFNIGEVQLAIVKAYGLSVPEVGDSDPNLTSGLTKN